MRRDMNLIRLLLLEAEDEEKPDLSAFEEKTLWMHRYWLIEAELAIGAWVETGSGTIVVHELSRLTWNGCEFLDAIRDESVWKGLQKSFNGFKTSFTLPLLKDVAVQLIKASLT